MLNFRKDINGLRAIAVIFVVLYHFKVPFFSGGFVGVDIFFVISGFLLTSIASHEMTKGTFTRANFLAHRLRRIYPALAVVIIFCLAFGYQSYLPDDYRALVKNGFSALIVRSNYAFLGDSNYFSADSSNNILLHTWSLSLEWQFYLVFAAIFPFFFKNTSGHQPVWKNALLISVFFISLAWCVVHSNTEQLSSFYLLPTRIWEFLAGSILALYDLKSVNNNFRKIAGIFGLSLLIYCVVLFNEKTLFPSWNALVPVIGVCFILFSKEGPVTRFLSISPAQYIGNISYSVYLWHWPLYVITCQYYGKELNYYQISMLIVATFIFSIVSVNFIEQPFRKKSVLKLL